MGCVSGVYSLSIRIKSSIRWAWPLTYRSQRLGDRLVQFGDERRMFGAGESLLQSPQNGGRIKSCQRGRVQP
jgi:hypothetical protein